MTDHLHALREAMSGGDGNAAAAAITEMLAAGIPDDEIWATVTRAAGYARAACVADRQEPAGIPSPVQRSRSDAQVSRAEYALDTLAGRGDDPGTKAIVHALLAVATVIEDGAERAAEDIDAAAAMLADRIEGLGAPPRRGPVRAAGAWLRYRWRSWRGTAPVALITMDCIGNCGQPAHLACGGCACAGGCRCSLRCRCFEASG
jgi:hypothetical protein